MQNDVPISPFLIAITIDDEQRIIGKENVSSIDPAE